MQKSVGCFTDEKLKELAEQPNTIVMQPTWDVEFEAWPAQKVSIAIDTIVNITKDLKDHDIEAVHGKCEEQETLKEFSQKYQLIYKKITDYSFIKEKENLTVLKKMVMIKSAVDTNTTSMQNAQAQVSDIALTSLQSRVKSKVQPGSSEREESNKGSIADKDSIADRFEDITPEN
jgi:hypothetical protein